MHAGKPLMLMGAYINRLHTSKHVPNHASLPSLNSNMSEIYIRQSCDVAGLALLLYELFLTWDQEYQCIWRNSDWFTTSSFVLSRYLAPVIQIINTVYSFLLLQRPDANCFHWFIFQTYTVLILLGNLELVMMVRVFALYERKPMFGFLLTLWFFSSRGLNVWNGLESLRDMEIEPFCIPNRTPDSSKWFGLTILTNQLLLWLLTLKKYRSAKKYRWSIPPVLRRVMRDSSWILALLTGLSISLLPYALFVQRVGNMIFCLMICLFSITVRAFLNRVTFDQLSYFAGMSTDSKYEEHEKHDRASRRRPGVDHSTNGVIWYILGVNFALHSILVEWPPWLSSSPRKSYAGFIAASLTGAMIAVGFWAWIALMRFEGREVSWDFVRGVTLGGGGEERGGVDGVAEAMDLGSLDDNLTLPIISGGCILGFLSLAGWISSSFWTSVES
ncbi:hypothetical protein D9756_010988 [Leucocoprinus leucothites]|uniref:DUF6533 domain-containing protein n=1 Tax=Leucocoprinus leucothites TaxID=201217 RepID=A0A8H5FQX0_9AGAR|nr:hypothetical protein D9756_010988 [Leucoagaricus leucothites]